MCWLCEALSSQCVRSLLLRSPCVSCARRDRQGLWKRTLAFFQLAVACEVPVVLLSVSEVPEDLGHVFRKMCLPSASILRDLDRCLLGDLVPGTVRCLASRVPLDHLDAFSVSSGRPSLPGEPLSENACNALGAELWRCLERAITVERDPPTWNRVGLL